MNRKRLIWIVLSGVLMTGFFLAACMTTTMDEQNHIHANMVLMGGFAVFSLVHIYCTCTSR